MDVAERVRSDASPEVSWLGVTNRLLESKYLSAAIGSFVEAFQKTNASQARFFPRIQRPIRLQGATRDWLYACSFGC